MAVGIPGMLLALLTWQIKEPPRGLSEGLISSESKNPLKETFKELVGLTPFGLLGSDKFKKELSIKRLLSLRIYTKTYFLDKNYKKELKTFSIIMFKLEIILFLN